jgi:hypothetical protein
VVVILSFYIYELIPNLIVGSESGTGFSLLAEPMDCLYLVKRGRHVLYYRLLDDRYD